MVVMEKNNEKKFVFDCFIQQYRAHGWNVSGEVDTESVLPDTVSDSEANTESVLPDTVSDSENADSVFVCPHCGKTYAKQASLKAHIKRSHKEE